MRHRNAVDVRLGDLRELADHVADLVGGDVLALPAERVAQAVDEVDAPVGVLALHVARAEPEVALFEDVLDHALVACGLVVEVALEHGVRGGGVEFVEDFAGFAVAAGDGEAGGVAEDVFGDDVDLHADFFGGVLEAPEEAAAADGVCAEGPAVVVEGGAEAVGGGVELVDYGDVEAGAEGFPYVGAHAVAPGHGHDVGSFEGVGGGVDEVAAEFADVLDYGGFVGGDFRPESLVAEFA